MSLAQALNNAVNEYIQKYIQQISTKYELDATLLSQEWDKLGLGETEATPNNENYSNVVAPATNTLTPEYLLGCLKPELKVLCKERGLKSTGTKPDLLAILNSHLHPNVVEPVVKNTKSTPPITKNLHTTLPTVAVRRNQFGNHEHPETSFVFDKKTKKVIGKQNDDGSVEPLTRADIDICNKYNFEYILPLNLDHAKLTDVKIAELDDDEDDDEIVESDEDVLLDEDILDEEDEEEEEEEEDFEDFEE